MTFSRNIHEPQDMAHARKMKTISKDIMFMGKSRKEEQAGILCNLFFTLGFMLCYPLLLLILF
jgi:hypothetical protein